MAGKRGNNEGSITKRSDGRWEARITLPGGKRKSLYAKTRQEAARRLAEAVRNLDHGVVPVGEKQATGRYLSSWLETIQPPILRSSTYTRYSQIVRCHLIPALGSIPLAHLSPQQVQACYAQKLRDGMAPNSLHLLHAVLHRALDRAQRLNLVVRNVCELVEAPKLQRTEMMPLTAAQAQHFLSVARETRFEALFVLAVTTGMRQGELLGLKWRDVDLDEPAIHVRATLHVVSGVGPVIAEPKTKRSRRKVALTARAVDALRRHRTLQLEERLKLGAAWNEQDIVFPNMVGNPMECIDLRRRYFRPLIQRAGLPPIRFHDLRHTAATLMLRQGTHPKVVAEMLGHAQISTTLDVYSHVLPDMQAEATAALDRLLGS
jgi:integrase